MPALSAKIILVHGTWGRGFNPVSNEPNKLAAEHAAPYWFEPSSKFFDHLRRGLAGVVQTVKIGAFLWSGANSIDERASAATRLAAELDASISSSPGIPHFVIAHSHAGNVALRACQEMTSELKQLHIVTLSTPFISIRQQVPGWTGRLLTIGLSIGLLILSAYLTYLFPAFFILLVLLPIYFRKTGNPLFRKDDAAPVFSGHFASLKILRSPRDEASLALIGGRVASFLAHIASGISILVPLLTSAAAVSFLFMVLWFLYVIYQAYHECVSTGTPCVLPGEFGIIAIWKAGEFLDQSLRFVSVGFCVSAFFIGLAAVSKSLFGRELIHRSLNVSVEVHDTPDGSNDYLVDWCPPLRGNLFAFRHSLYDNPAAIEKIVTHISDVCAKSNAESPLSTHGPYIIKRRTLPSLAAATLFVAILYATAVLIAYAPSGAVSMRCALGYYVEPASPKGQFSILVTRFANDSDAAEEKTFKAIRQIHGLTVSKTCLYVAESEDGESSSRKLLNSYGSALVISGRGTKDGSELLIDASGHSTTIVSLPAGVDEETIAKRLDAAISRSISEWSQEVHTDLPANNLSLSAMRIEAFSSWRDRRPLSANDESDAFLGLKAHIDLEASIGRLQTVTALANHDGGWAEKAIAHFDRATALFNVSADYKGMLREYWKNNYHEALLADAQFSKSLKSARLAAAIYAKGYGISVTSRATSALDLHNEADNAAAAAWALYEIDHNDDGMNSISRFACLSLYWLRNYAYFYEERMKPNDPLAKQGLSNGVLRSPPAPEKSRGYQLLKEIKKDPGIILAPRSRISEPKDCNSF